MRFQFRYEYTTQDMVTLSRVTSRVYRRQRTMIARAAYVILGLVYLGLGTTVYAGGDIGLGTLLIGASALFIGIAILYHRWSARRSRKRMAGFGQVTADLEDGGIRGKSRKGESFYPYDEVVGAFHCRGVYFLFLDATHAVLLPERAQVAGEPGALRPWLERKLKQEIIEIG